VFGIVSITVSASYAADGELKKWQLWSSTDAIRVGYTTYDTVYGYGYNRPDSKYNVYVTLQYASLNSAYKDVKKDCYLAVAAPNATGSVCVKTLKDQVYNYRVKFNPAGATKLGCSMYGMVYTWD